MPICYSWGGASARILKAIGRPGIRVLTVDVFDTLLLRATSPGFVAQHSKSVLSEQAGVTPEIAASSRDRAWRTATSTSVSLGHDPDCSSNVYFSTWVKMAAGDRLPPERIESIASYLIAAELRAEQACLCPNPAMKIVIAAAVAKGIAVHAISDMYLSSSEVRHLLEAHGMAEGISSVTTSGDCGMQKRTGRLFRHFMTASGLKPDEIIHVGDDLVADWQMPGATGIRTFCVRDGRQMAARAHSAILDRKISSGRDGGFAVSDMASRASRPSSDLLFETGRTAFGPIYAPFLHGVADRALKGNFDSVWFMAREGWLLLELYEMARKAGKADLPPSGYLYVSRLSTLRASMDAFSLKQAENVLNNSPEPTYGKFLKPFGFAEGEQILADMGFAGGELPSLAGVQRIIDSRVFKDAAKEVAEGERANLARYLESTGFPKTGRVAVVDVGWGGQIQENFQTCLNLLGWKVEVHGMYLGTDSRADARREAGLHIESVLVDSAAEDRRGQGVFCFVQGIELATRSQHGSVLGYGDDGLPILDSGSEARRKEEIDDPKLARLQAGILEYGAAWFPVAAIAALDADASADAARSFIDLLCTVPSRRVAGTLLDLNNVANLGMDEGLLLGRKVPLFRPRALVRAVRRTLWQEGSVTWTAGPAGALVLLAYRKFRRGGQAPISVRSSTCQSWQLNERRPAPIADAMGLELPSLRKDFCVGLEFTQPDGLASITIKDALKLGAVNLIQKTTHPSGRIIVDRYAATFVRIKASTTAKIAKMVVRKFL